MQNKKISEFALVDAAGQTASNTFFGGYDPTRSAGDRNIRMNAEEIAKLTGLKVGNTVTDGTANRVLYINGSGNLADSANLTFSGTQLGLADGTAAAPSLKIGSAESGLFRSTGTNIERLGLAVDGNEVIRLFSDTGTLANRVGINRATDPIASLDVQGNSSENIAVFRDSSGNAKISLLSSGALSISTPPGNLLVGQNNATNLTGANNVLFGVSAGEGLTSGNNNLLIGTSAGRLITTQSANVIIGGASGFNLIGAQNVFVGTSAGTNATSGNRNILIGQGTDKSTPTAANELNIGNSFFGTDIYGDAHFGINKNDPDAALDVTSLAALDIAKFRDSSGNQRAAIRQDGYFLVTPSVGGNTIFTNAISASLSGVNNTLFGSASGNNLTTGRDNTFLGRQTGTLTTTGVGNTFAGVRAGNQNTIGFSNSFFGVGAGNFCTDGHSNTIFGDSSGQNLFSTVYNAIFGRDSGTNLGAELPFNSVTDLGGGQVRINTTKHAFFVGQEIIISGTTNYNGTYTVQAVSSTEITINATFVASESGTIVSKAWNDSTNTNKGSYNILFGGNSLRHATSSERTIAIGYSAGLGSGITSVEDSYNCILIGNEITLSAASVQNELNIGDVIFGENLYPAGNNGNIGLNTREYGSGEGVLAIADAATNSSTAPTAGFVMESEGGVPYFRDSDNEYYTPKSNYAGMYISTPLETTISASNTPVKLAGTTTANGLTAEWSHSTGRLTYSGKNETFHVIAALSIESASNNQNVGLFIAKNGTVISESELFRKIANANDQGSITIQAIVDMSDTDYLEVFVENRTSSGNVTSEKMYFVAKKV